MRTALTIFLSVIFVMVNILFYVFTYSRNVTPDIAIVCLFLSVIVHSILLYHVYIRREEKANEPTFNEFNHKFNKEGDLIG